MSIRSICVILVRFASRNMYRSIKIVSYFGDAISQCRLRFLVPKDTDLGVVPSFGPRIKLALLRKWRSRRRRQCFLEAATCLRTPRVEVFVRTTCVGPVSVLFPKSILFQNQFLFSINSFVLYSGAVPAPHLRRAGSLSAKRLSTRPKRPKRP